MPTSLLISQVGDPSSYSPDAMKALTGRALSPAQKRGLAVALLDKRRARSYLDRSEDAWLIGEIAAGSLPPEVRNRYYSEMAAIWVVAPERGRAEEAFRVGIGVSDHSPLDNANRAYLVVGGYWIKGDEGRVERGNTAESAIMVGMEQRSFGRMQRAEYQHEAWLKVAAPGRISVRLECWLIVMAGSTAVPITWNDDGTLALPPGVVYSERREVMRDVEIVP